jgi:hypothetical protein
VDQGQVINAGNDLYDANRAWLDKGVAMGSGGQYLTKGINGGPDPTRPWNYGQGPRSITDKPTGPMVYEAPAVPQAAALPASPAERSWADGVGKGLSDAGRWVGDMANGANNAVGSFIDRMTAPSAYIQGARPWSYIQAGLATAAAGNRPDGVALGQKAYADSEANFNEPEQREIANKVNASKALADVTSANARMMEAQQAPGLARDRIKASAAEGEADRRAQYQRQTRDLGTRAKEHAQQAEQARLDRQQRADFQEDDRLWRYDSLNAKGEKSADNPFDALNILNPADPYDVQTGLDTLKTQYRTDAKGKRVTSLDILAPDVHSTVKRMNPTAYDIFLRVQGNDPAAVNDPKAQQTAKDVQGQIESYAVRLGRSRWGTRNENGRPIVARENPYDMLKRARP